MAWPSIYVVLFVYLLTKEMTTRYVFLQYLCKNMNLWIHNQFQIWLVLYQITKDFIYFCFHNYWVKEFCNSKLFLNNEYSLIFNFFLWRYVLRREISGSFFLSLSFSRTQVVIEKSSNDKFFLFKKGVCVKNHHLSENFIVLNKRSCHLMNF